MLASQYFSDSTTRRALVRAARNELVALASERSTAVAAMVDAWKLEARLSSADDRVHERIARFVERPYSKHRLSVERALEALVVEREGLVRMAAYDVHSNWIGSSEFDSSSAGDAGVDAAALSFEGLKRGEIEVLLDRDAGDVPISRVFAPVFSRGVLVGYLEEARSFAPMEGLIDALPGRTSAHQLIWGRQADGTQSVLASDRGLRDLGSLPPFDWRQKGSTELFGESWMLESSSIPGLQLGAAALVPLRVALGGADALRRLVIGLSAIVLLGVVLIVHALSKRIAEPVESMASVAQRVKEGDTSARATEFRSSELGLLGSTFNEMLWKLEQRRGVLEAEVAKRTEDLVHTNAALETQKEDLARSNADLRQFAYVASHDLRTPLRGISNLAAWLEEELGDSASESAAEYLGLLKGRVGRLERLLTDLLAYAQAGQDKHPLERVEVERLLHDVIELEGVADRVELELPSDLPVLHTRRIALQTVLQNLVSNSVKHAGSGALRLRLDWSVEGPLHTFEFADDGPGIAAQHRDRVFQVFQTLAPKADGIGTGIGLALVRKLVGLHGGRVRIVDSKNLSGLAIRFTWREGPSASLPDFSDPLAVTDTDSQHASNTWSPTR